jgi:hypothetical protein
MAEIKTTDAAGALADFFGPHLDGNRETGRRLMTDALHKQFNIPTREARQLVDALEHAGTIRWIVRHSATASSTLGQGAIPGVGSLDGDGYWQLEPV